MRTSRRIAAIAPALLLALGGLASSALAQTDYARLRLAARAEALADDARGQAARAAAEGSPACASLSFYWEIGNGSGPLVSGAHGEGAPQATAPLNLYSASKWVYAAYVYERRGGALNEADLRSLRMLDGYTETSGCAGRETVGRCFAAMGERDSADVDRFHYASGHFQKHAAVDMELADKNTEELAAEIHRVLGTGWAFDYVRVDLAGGGRGSAADYGVFLRKLLNRELKLSGEALGSNAVCTYTGPADPATGRTPCKNAASSPASEALQYSLGHWIESDPQWLAQGGDPAFTSPGLTGFYPWIDASRTYYGIVARDERVQGSAAMSVACGRQIRKAWLAGASPHP